MYIWSEYDRCVLFALHCGKGCFLVFLSLMQNTTCLDSYDCGNNCAFTSLTNTSHVSQSVNGGEYEPSGLLHSIAVVYMPILVSVVNS